MTKDEQKNYTTPTKMEEKDEEKMTEPEEQELHSIASNKTVEAPPPVKPDITVITARLDAAVKAYTPVNRSSDLVPLNHDYDIMRKTLRALIGATKQYKLKRGEMDKARMEVVMQLSALSTKSPIHEHIGNTLGDSSSVASINQQASTKAHEEAEIYQSTVIDYAIEWERIVTTRADFDLAETGKLHSKLNHYQNKVDSLRKSANAKETQGKASPARLTTKLERNEGKLNEAWKQHERSASKLCNLLEQVTERGWKDLYPLVLAMLDWEKARSSQDYDVFKRLPFVKEKLTTTYKAKNLTPDKEISGVPVVLAEPDASSDTTGSFHPEEDSSVTSVEPNEGEGEGDVTPQRPNVIEGKVTYDNITLASPKGVVHQLH